MGMFQKSDEKLKYEENARKMRLLINEIKARQLEDKTRDFYLNYLDNIRKGYPNDFGDMDTLFQVFMKLLDSNFSGVRDLREHFEQMVQLYHKMVNSNKEELDMKNIFIHNFVGTDGLLYNDYYDDAMYSTFQNKKDYFDIMNVIMSDGFLKSEFDTISDYISKVSKYCLSQDMLKRDVISFLNGFFEVVDDDYEKYSEECLEEAKKRVGVYNLSPKQLASVETKIRKVEGFLEEMNTYMKNIKGEKEALSTIVTSSKEELDKESKKSLESLREMITKEKELLTKKLDDYLLELEQLLSDKSDALFKDIIIKYKGQLEQFRNMFQMYSRATSQDLLAIQKASEDSVKQLKEYVSNEPQLQELLVKANEQNAVRTKIVNLVEKEEQLLAVPQKVEEVSIPGYESRIMVPYKHMVLPNEIAKSPIYPFDESIPFSQRKEEIYKKIEERQKQGEIFHKKVPQIAIDLMEGDWPYLWGPSGTGKSYMAKQVASLLGMNLTKAGKITEPYSVLGYNDPQGRYQITPSFIAALYGNLLFLDELDNGNPDTQVVLNDIYSELLNKLDNPNDICEVTFGTDVNVDINPNFRMLGAGNTSGEGENEAFSSRGKMDESIQERMTPIYVDYDDRVEEQILKDYPEWYDFFIKFRNACVKYSKSIGHQSPQGITTTRDAAAIKKYISHNSKSIDQVLQERFIQIKDSEYRKALAKSIAKEYGLSYEEEKGTKFSDPLEKASGKVLAKQFVSLCKNGDNR